LTYHACIAHLGKKSKIFDILYITFHYFGGMETFPQYKGFRLGMEGLFPPYQCRNSQEFGNFPINNCCPEQLHSRGTVPTVKENTVNGVLVLGEFCD